MSHNLILEILEKNGFQARMVGGCVRDNLLSREPKDIDIVTNADPDQIVRSLACFKLVLTGKQFGCIKVILSEKQEIDVVTLRSDSDYSDGRRPDKVEFVGCFKTDADRRDFTINGLSQCKEGNIYDYHRGEEDLKEGIIRTIGFPRERFQEDYLRMLRAIRFASQLNFEIAPLTWEAIKGHASKIENVSAERITEEFKKILLSPHPVLGLQLLKDSGILEVILPEIKDLWGIRGDVWQHSLNVVQSLVDTVEKPSFILMFAGLLHDIGKPSTFAIENGKITNNGHAETGAEIAQKICERFKLSNVETKQIVELVRMHMKMHVVREMRKSKLVALLGREDIENLISLQHADSLGALNASKSMRSFLREKQIEHAKTISVPPLVTGSDLIAIGLKPGPQFKSILAEIRELQLEEKLENRESALIYIEKYFSQK